MAGLGETCTHVAACLFFLEAAARHEESTTCTGKPCQWNMPAFQKNDEYSRVADIDFTLGKCRHEQFQEGERPVSFPTSKADVRHPSAGEKASFFRKISECDMKPATLSLIPAYSDGYVLQNTGKLPLPLSDLHHTLHLKKTPPELRRVGAEMSISITQEQATAVEEVTRGQA